MEPLEILEMPGSFVTMTAEIPDVVIKLDLLRGIPMRAVIASGAFSTKDVSA